MVAIFHPNSGFYIREAGLVSIKPDGELFVMLKHKHMQRLQGAGLACGQV